MIKNKFSAATTDEIKENIYGLKEITRQEMPTLLKLADRTRRENKTDIITFSRNITIPLTNICRNKCGYCGFRRKPTDPEAYFLTPPQITDIATAGAKKGCTEALFTFGERPDTYPSVRQKLTDLGYGNIIDYLHDMCREVINKTGLLPHSNPGYLTHHELKLLKAHNASLGLMLENVSARLTETPAHKDSPGKVPKKRLEVIEAAGKLKIPFTTGLLIGIGETRKERIDSLLYLRELHEKYGHIQEIIIQNFQPKSHTPMASYPPPTSTEMLWTVAITRLLFPKGNVQVPPNLNRETLTMFLHAGVNDFGGISPLTTDYINPECPWPTENELREITHENGFILKERLPIYPEFIKNGYLGNEIKDLIFSLVDSDGYVGG